jgi:hypothetical protein
MWEEILFETVKVQAFLLAIEQVLVSEEDLDFLLAEWNAVLHNLGGQEDFLCDVAKTREVETGVGNFSTSKHVPQLLPQFVTNGSAQKLFLNATEKIGVTYERDTYFF